MAADQPPPGPSGLRIFINYRRSDAADITDRLYDGLAAHFGDDHVFMDIDAIDPGLDFRKVITDAVDSCDVCIAVIGRQWLTATDEAGTRRLDDPHDFVRMELHAALERGVRVVPVLVQGMEGMPGARDLPDGLQDLAWRNAIKLRRESWNHDLARLIQALDRVRGQPALPAAASSEQPPGDETSRPPRRIQFQVRFLGIAASLTVVGVGVAIALAVGTGGVGGSGQNTLAASPPATVRPEATSVPAPSSGPATATSASPAPSGAVARWPAGVTAYTVILASDRSRSRAVADAERALNAGLTHVGVLRSADYSSLRPGFWIAFVGQFRAPRLAEAERDRARTRGFPHAYAKLVSP